MSTAAGASMLAHAVHYAVVLGGVLGLALLLVPHVTERLRVDPAPARSAHEDRVRRLSDWPGLARGWTACSVLLLGLLSLSGAGS